MSFLAAAAPATASAATAAPAATPSFASGLMGALKEDSDRYKMPPMAQMVTGMPQLPQAAALPAEQFDSSAAYRNRSRGFGM